MIYRTILTLLLLVTFLPGHAQGQDSSPWNPANWHIGTEQQGSDTIVSWVNAPGPQQVTDVYDWSLAGPSRSASNSTGISQTVTYLSKGTTRIKVLWIGVGPAPSKVLVRINSEAGYSYRRSGSGMGTADNGIGSPTVETSNPFNVNGKADAPKLRYLAISNGEGEITISSEAYAQSTGTNAVCTAGAWRVSLEIAERATEIIPWVSPTYRPAFNDAPVAIENPDPTAKKMNVGISYLDGQPQGSVVGSLIAGLWGPWIANPPQFVWSFNDMPQATLPDQAIINRVYTTAEIANISMTGPVVLTNTVTVTDSDSVTRAASVEVSIYAPQMFPVISTSTRAYDDYKRVSPLAHRDPSSTTAIQNSDAYAKAVTKQITIGLSVGGIPVSAISPITLALNAQYQYGVTATVTKTYTITYTLSAGPDDTEFWIEKRNFWLEKTGSYSSYGPNGYEGLKNLFMTVWESGTKELAEQIDHEHRLASRPIGF